jgi:peroxin-3
MVLDGLEREVFGEVPSVQEVDPSAETAGSTDKSERLAGILPGLARWCHPALYGLPNELVEVRPGFSFIPIF